MGESGDDHEGSRGLRPGALTALLEEIAASPEAGGRSDTGLAPGTVVGRFEIVRELGRGGFGVVYEARDRDLGRNVAFKLVRVGSAKSGADQLKREAEVVARLSHPNLVTLHDVGNSEHGPYLVLELLRGETLQERLARGPLPVREALAIAVEAAKGLAHAHGEGVVHRDLKPSNVFLVEKGGVKLLDFGMAHAFGRRRVSGGTPAYMAPEQWEDSPEDERTDIFALGVMLHRMLTGEYPYPEAGGRWASGPAEAFRLTVPASPALGDLVGRLVARAPKDRPRDGAEVLEELSRVLDDLPRSVAAAPVRVNRKLALAGFVAELQRRRVFRALVTYSIAGVIVLRVSDSVVQSAHLPEWILFVEVVLLGLGFPVTVGLAWVFDLTSGGVQRTPARRDDPHAGTMTLPRGPRLALLLFGLGLLASTPGLVYYFLSRPGRAPVASGTSGLQAGPSIAVLPFADLSPKHDQEYFADGVAEEILNALAQVEGLRVPGRTSSFWFRGKTAELAEIGLKLNVTHILEGSVRRAGKRLRVTAQVVKVADGYHVWSETFDRAEADIFKVQDEVAQAVVKALQVKLLGGAPRPGADVPAAPGGGAQVASQQLVHASTASLAAYEQYLLGNQRISSFAPGDVRRAVAAYEKAVALDPGLAPAWAKLARALLWGAEQIATADAERTRRRGVEAAERAVALAPGSADGYASRARMRAAVLWDFAGAAEDDARAQVLDAHDSWVHIASCVVKRSLGRLAESAAACNRAIEMDPLSVAARNQLTNTLLDAGDLVQARRVNAQALEISPESASARVNRCELDVLEANREAAAGHCGALAYLDDRLFWAAAMAQVWGTPGEASAALDAFASRVASRDPYAMAQLHAQRGDVDRAFEWLERAWESRVGLDQVKNDHRLRQLRSDRRYRVLLEKLKLPLD